MENYKVKGKITLISEIKTLENGAKTLNYRIDNGQPYNNIMQFEMYKKAEFAEHIDNFIKYNKINDEVEIEFNIKTREWEGRLFTNLASWKCNKATASTPDPDLNNSDTESDDLPF